MRRKHWWGATLGAGVVAGAAFLAPAALAVPLAQSHPVSRSGNGSGPNGQAGGYENQRRIGNGQDYNKCQYPPLGTPEVAITDGGRNSSRYWVRGSATLNTCPFANKKVGLYQHIGGSWPRVGSGSTDRRGNFTISWTSHDRGRKNHHAPILVRAVTERSRGIHSAQSNVFSLH